MDCLVVGAELECDPEEEEVLVGADHAGPLVEVGVREARAVDAHVGDSRRVGDEEGGLDGVAGARGGFGSGGAGAVSGSRRTRSGEAVAASGHGRGGEEVMYRRETGPTAGKRGQQTGSGAGSLLRERKNKGDTGKFPDLSKETAMWQKSRPKSIKLGQNDVLDFF